MRLEIKGPTDWWKVKLMPKGGVTVDTVPLYEFVECEHVGYEKDVTALDLTPFMEEKDSSNILSWDFFSGWGVRIVDAEDENWKDAEQWEVFGCLAEAKVWAFSELHFCPLCFTYIGEETDECESCMAKLTEEEVKQALARIIDYLQHELLDSKTVYAAMLEEFKSEARIVGYAAKVAGATDTIVFLENVMEKI